RGPVQPGAHTRDAMALECAGGPHPVFRRQALRRRRGSGRRTGRGHPRSQERAMTKALRGAPALLAAFLALQGPGVPPPPSPSEDETIEELRATHQRLHEELQALVDRDPVVRRVFTDRGQVVVAVQSRWIETVLADLAMRYFEGVTVDLRSVEASAGGTIRTDTLVGRIALGDWHV